MEEQGVAVKGNVKVAVKRAARDSLEMFARTYLGGHFGLPPSRMHRELFGLLEAAVKERGARIAVAAPRGHAKSTVVSLAYVLWCVCYGREPYIMLISNAADQAADLLSAVKHELEANELILEDFPDVAEPGDVKPPAERWRRAEIITRNGVKISALGAGQKVRGRKHRQDRPTLIIVDDIENEAEMASAEGRASKRQWFMKAVMKAGTTARTNVIVVGTILHYDSLLAKLTGSVQRGACSVQEDGRGAPGWQGRIYRAITAWAGNESLWREWESIYSGRAEHNRQTGATAALAFYQANEKAMMEGAEVLWPERESYYQLMEMRLCEGRASFDSEKQNEPVDGSECLFNVDKFVYWDDQYKSAHELIAHVADGQIYGACDPSLGMAGRNRDDTAIVSVLRDARTGMLYVLDADIARRKPEEIINMIIQYHRLRRYEQFGMEATQFQAFLARELGRIATRAGERLAVKEIRHNRDKLGRIQSLEPLVATGMLQFSRRHRGLLEQLRQFPKASHDDGPDALEMAVKIAQRGPAGKVIVRRY